MSSVPRSATASGFGPAVSQAVPVPIAATLGPGHFAITTMWNGVSVVLPFLLVNYIKLEPVVAGALLFGSRLPGKKRACAICLVGFVAALAATALLACHCLERRDLE